MQRNKIEFLCHSFISKHTNSINLKLYCFIGTNAGPGEFPWGVFICYSESPDQNSCILPCGGSLISEEVVLTAKHCLPNETSLENYRIYAGSNKLMGGEKRGIQKIIFNNESDTALVVLNSKFDSSNIQTIAMADANESIPEGLNATASGWGQTSCIGDNPSFAKYLQKIIIPVLPSNFSQCKVIFKTL